MKQDLTKSINNKGEKLWAERKLLVHEGCFGSLRMCPKREELFNSLPMSKTAKGLERTLNTKVVTFV